MEPNKQDRYLRIAELRTLLQNALLPLVNADYILLDCPYYFNIGDILIWKGTNDLLKSSPHKCLGQYSMHTFPDDMRLSPETVILLEGGGNFGDIWRKHSEFRLKIAERYPENKIIILPQSVHYKDVSILKQDAKLFAKHKDLTICVRDRQSLSLIEQNFSNNVLLLPDMAIHLDLHELAGYGALYDATLKKVLYLKRRDKEGKGQTKPEKLMSVEYDTRDWIGYGKSQPEGLYIRLLMGLLYTREKLFVPDRFMRMIMSAADKYAYFKFMPYMVGRGVEFLSGYEKVFTTRLHVGILSVLLGRETIFLDNSYGKNSGFYNAWLQGLRGVDLYPDNHS